MYLYYLIALIVIGIDQLTKWIVVENMELQEHITIIENYLSITSLHNSKSALRILKRLMIFLYIITTVVIIGIIYYLQKYGSKSKLLAMSLSFILGGAIGNFIDRIFRKEVVDFLDFAIFTYDYPIFNIADSSLVIGVILIIIATFIDEKKKGKGTS